MAEVKQVADNKSIINRLRRAQGQLAGLERLIKAEADCEKVLMQLAAVRAALEQLSLTIISKNINECLQKNELQKIDALLKRYLKGSLK